MNNRFEHRLSLPAIMEALKNFTDEQDRAVEKIGLGGLLKLKCSQLDHELCEWLVKVFDIENCSLSLHGTTAKISPKDVERILGVRAQGDMPEKSSDKELEDLAYELGFRNGTLTLTQLKDDLKKTQDAGNNFIRRFVLLAMGCLCLPGTKSGIRSSLLYLVKDATKLEKINWGKLILDYLVDGVTKYKTKNTSGVAGCLFFLMVRC